MDIAVIDTESQGSRVDPTWLHYKGKLFTGVQDVCDLYGIQSHYFQSEIFTHTPAWETFAGVIALTNRSDEKRRRFWDRVPAGLPRVFLGSGMEYNHVESDQEAGMALLIGHLMQEKYTRIGYLHAGATPGGFGAKRHAAALKAFRDRGAKPIPGIIHDACRSDFRPELKYLAPIFSSYVKRHRPDAIAFSTDELASHFTGWAREAGVRIPEDIAITGYNDFLLTDWLTTIHYDFHTVGQLAVHALRDMLRGRRPMDFGRILVPPRLCIRASSTRIAVGRAPGAESHFRDMVERSFQLSRDNPHLASALASRLELTRPYFLRKFRWQFGMEFSSWVSRRRLEYTALYLRSTKRPITELWMESGFKSAQHFNRLFRSVYGLTPGVYRRRMGETEDDR